MTRTKRLNLNGLMGNVTKMYRAIFPSRMNCGRKRFGPGTAKNYNERASKNSFNHYSPRADHNGWNAVER